MARCTSFKNVWQQAWCTMSSDLTVPMHLQSQPAPPVCGAQSQQVTVRLKQRSFFMGLLERVSTLIRANINDVIDRAEDPEKMIKQVILDMENQYMQVK